jgi:hypothetical protein
MTRFEGYRDSFPNARLSGGVGYGLALEGISAADVARSVAANR